VRSTYYKILNKKAMPMATGRGGVGDRAVGDGHGGGHYEYARLGQRLGYEKLMLRTYTVCKLFGAKAFR